MWETLLNKVLSRMIRRGRLVVHYPSGNTAHFGHDTSEPITVTVTDHSLPRRMVINPELALGEGYMHGGLTIENDDVAGLLGLGLMNRGESHGDDFTPWLVRTFKKAVRGLAQYNPAGRAKANVAHHYDLSAELYDLFLDADRQYSCAYFPTGTETIDEAQEAKKRHIARKLLISPGMRVLDIGCGWGGMAMTLARDYGANVVGITLSEEQIKLGRERVKAAGLEDKIELRMQDYRNVTGKFDRIVSVGMFEHVGTPHYQTFFNKVADLLTEDGVALIHAIGRTSPPGVTSDWILKYIFPGGYSPAMSEVMPHVERADLYPTDIEVWRLHYAETLRHWRKRFMANADKAAEIYDEVFVRMWRYYLIAAEMTFRYDHQCVFQYQLARRQENVPLTRDYLYPPKRPQAKVKAVGKRASQQSHAAE